MFLKVLMTVALAVPLLSMQAAAQQVGDKLKTTVAADDSKQSVSPLKSSPAYAELLLRRVERESELEDYAINYTDEYPRVKEINFEINLINQAMGRILAVKAVDAGKLTLALGKLMVRKTELGLDLYKLHQQYTDDKPEIKRLRRRIEIFEKAIKEILQ